MAIQEKKYKLAAGFPVSLRREVDSTIIQEAVQHYDQGRYIDSWRVLEPHGPMQAWKNAEALVFGCRLAGNLAAGRLAALLIRRAARTAPHHPQVILHFGYHLQDFRGMMAAWRHALESEVHVAHDLEILADLKAMRARIAGSYRDFDTAWKLWEEAAVLNPDKPWLGVEKTSILLSQERREEALQTIEEALVLRPWYRPAVQHKGRVLHLLGRGHEAIQFLAEANARMQSHSIACQLLTLKREVDDHAGMAELVERIDSLSVLAEAAEHEWLQARRADVFYLKGDYSAAAAAAAQVSGDYYSALAKRLEQPGLQARRVRLPFEFVHQKHNTCAPATLAAVSHYWRKEITMEQIVDAICYDGTHDYSEREWAVANGFAVKEFTLTLESVRQLIDAQVPIVLTTVEVTSAHSQALIGYDDVRETLFIQDPGEPHYRETSAQEFLNSYKLTGPRGMALVPQERAEWLAAQSLPDEAMYDLNHRFSLALAAYDRPAAEAVWKEMESVDAGHRLVLMGRLSLASFDGNEVARAEALELLQKAFPEDPRLLYWKIQSLRGLGRSDERLRLLRDFVQSDKCQVWALRMYGEELLEDARSWPEARRQLRRAHVASPSDAGVLIRMADLMRRSQKAEPDDYLTIYRFAAALSDKVEGYAQIWFSHSVSLGRIEQAIDWLRRRMRAYGSKSAAPSLTLVQALDGLNRPEMVEVMHEAVAMRPDDGELLVELARLETRLGHFEEAASLLQRAEGKTLPARWQRAQALLLRRREGPAAELTMWQNILVLEPLAFDAHQVVARELAGTGGNLAAIRHLETVAARFPHHYSLGQLLVQWQHDTDAELALPQIQRMIEMHPTDPWARRQIALVFQDLGRHEEALAGAREAVALAPDEAAGHAIQGRVLQVMARDAEAAECFRQGIRLDVNYSQSFEALIRTAAGTDLQRKELAFIRSEMIRQVLNGSGLHAYRGQASLILNPHELHEELLEVWKARPDLWEAWSVLIQQKLDLRAREDALKLAQEATQRFALSPGAWRDLATVHRHSGDHPAALETMRRVTQMNPDWPDGWLLLAEYQEDAREAAAAVQTLRNGVARLPLELMLRGSLAALLWRTGMREEAWSLAERTALEEPGADWAWTLLNNWAEILQRQDRLLELGRSLTRQRPGDARAWMLLARLLPTQHIQEILHAFDQALKINPHLADAYDLRAETLASLGRIDEAEASLRTGPWEAANMPHNLCGRAAWLLAVRGDLVGAIQRMKMVLEKNSNYYWGWRMLSQWSEQRRDMISWRRAAQHMIQLNPRSAEPYNVAADAELQAGKRDAGIRHLRDALHVDPGDVYAAHRLLGLFWDARDMVGLAEAAQGMATHGHVGLVRRVYLMLAATEKQDLTQVRADLEWLATQPDMLGPMLELVQNRFQGHNKKLHNIYNEVVSQVAEAGRIGPAFAVSWVRRQHAQRNWACWRQLASWIPRLGTRIVPAVADYLDLMGEAKAANPQLKLFIQEHGTFLRGHTLLWSKVGYAFAASGEFMDCAQWLLPDYQRPDAEAWSLSNLCISLREIGDKAESARVSQHVVAMGLQDVSWPMHVAIAAHGAAKAGQYDEVNRILKREPFRGQASEWRVLALAAGAYAEVMSTPRDQARAAFMRFHAQAKEQLRGTALSKGVQDDLDLAVEKMKAHCGVRMPFGSRLKGGTPRAAPASGGGTTGFGMGIFGLIYVLFMLMRSCDHSTSQTMPRPSRQELDLLLKQSQQQVEASQPNREEFGLERPPANSLQELLDRQKRTELPNDLLLRPR
ncbi:tetratricopeptide repeat protein [Brevifollis gellanilyticus]|uniref:Peptidase C39-like domain-containing protein n=1 Tax=Brevifollis gellanilyticus TaxID=748831 RepID=A0A512M3T9_9BACT|nr:tetratricopeptide repeat protein [Brevifollis gellanilyticus]GEP41410.1 hypothetical protein BGE01nite_07010 [Brevifollis gellanilyticus]